MKDVWQEYSEEDFKRRKEEAQKQAEIAAAAPVYTPRKTTATSSSIPIKTIPPGPYQVQRKRAPWWVFLLAITVVSGYWTFHFLVLLPMMKQYQLSAIVTILNKACPQNLSKEVRWDSVQLLKDRTVQYNYTLLEVDKEKAEDTTAMQNRAKPLLTGNVQNDPQMTTFLKLKPTLVYCYYDRFGQYVFRLVLYPEDYSG